MKLVRNFLSCRYFDGLWNDCTIPSLELSVLLPDHVRTSKHLRVNIDQSSVKIIDQSTQAVILDDTLARKWKASEANWTLAGNKLQITVGECFIIDRD